MDWIPCFPTSPKKYGKKKKRLVRAETTYVRITKLFQTSSENPESEEEDETRLLQLKEKGIDVNKKRIIPPRPSLVSYYSSRVKLGFLGLLQDTYLDNRYLYFSTQKQVHQLMKDAYENDLKDLLSQLKSKKARYDNESVEQVKNLKHDISKCDTIIATCNRALREIDQKGFDDTAQDVATQVNDVINKIKDGSEKTKEAAKKIEEMSDVALDIGETKEEMWSAFNGFNQETAPKDNLDSVGEDLDDFDEFMSRVDPNYHQELIPDTPIQSLATTAISALKKPNQSQKQKFVGFEDGKRIVVAN